MSKPKIFLSAVSGQFRECRNALASDLRTIGAEVVVQEDFRQLGWTLLKELQDYIAGCDRVIALVGDAYGYEPEPGARPAGRPRRSYTQWEYFFALGERLDGSTAPPKPTSVYLANEDYLKDRPAKPRPELTTEENAEQAKLQQEFRTAIHVSGKRYEKFGSQDTLDWTILAIPPESMNQPSIPGTRRRSRRSSSGCPEGPMFTSFEPRSAGGEAGPSRFASHRRSPLTTAGSSRSSSNSP